MEKTYKVNEIFYSLQGEGSWAGKAAIFVRFSGCNLKCPFCDTDFKAHKDMTIAEILDALEEWKECRFVVLTGGEPTLQIDNEFIEALLYRAYYVAIETNGTMPVPSLIDWITVSPKSAYVANADVRIKEANEVKVVYDGEHEPSDFGIEADEYFVQPCDVGNPKRNAEIIRESVEWVKQHPKWRLSLQQQKILNVR